MLSKSAPASDDSPVVDPVARRRDHLWEVSFETFYDAKYIEVLSERLEGEWLIVDKVVAVLVALTASGSAVAGWALWKDGTPASLWAVLSGSAALLAIVHSTLGVPATLKAHGECRRYFTHLSLDIESLRMRMRTNQSFDIDTLEAQFDDCRKRFSSGIGLRQADLLSTRRFQVKVQEALNEQLADEIVPDA